MNDKPQISESARKQLREELVPEVAIEAAECILGHLIETAATMAREYDPEAGDDPNLAGMIVSRRAKNVAAHDLRAQNLSDLSVRAAKGFTWDINADGTLLHVYSAPGGLDAFELAGGDRKAEIVGRSMKQLSLFEKHKGKEQPGDLILAYVRGSGGVRRAILGVLGAADKFAWEVLIYEADEVAEQPSEEETPKRPQSFREQPEEKPDLSLKPEEEKRDNRENQ